jgi:uncharacterized protein YjbJ (UPF0337 family)
MDNKTQLKANWEEARGRVKKAWGALTDDDLLQAQGNWDQLVATIRGKTGEGMDVVEQKLNQILDTISAKGKPK